MSECDVFFKLSGSFSRQPSYSRPSLYVLFLSLLAHDDDDENDPCFLNPLLIIVFLDELKDHDQSQ